MSSYGDWPAKIPSICWMAAASMSLASRDFSLILSTLQVYTLHMDVETAGFNFPSSASYSPRSRLRFL